MFELIRNVLPACVRVIGGGGLNLGWGPYILRGRASRPGRPAQVAPLSPAASLSMEPLSPAASPNSEPLSPTAPLSPSAGRRSGHVDRGLGVGPDLAVSGRGDRRRRGVQLIVGQ